MEIENTNTLKTIALAIHEGNDFFVCDGIVYEGNEQDEREACSEHCSHINEPMTERAFIEWCATECVPLADYDDSDYNNDFLVLDDSEADEKCAEEITELLWAFNADFLSSVTGFDSCIFEAIQNNGKSEDNNSAILQLVGDDLERLIEQAIASDGRGHFLSRYDGHEHEVNAYDYSGLNQYFYIYRQN